MVEALVFWRNREPRRFHHTGADLLRWPSSAVVSKEKGEFSCVESATAFPRRPGVLVCFSSCFPLWRIEHLDNCSLYGGYRSSASCQTSATWANGLFCWACLGSARGVAIRELFGE